MGQTTAAPVAPATEPNTNLEAGGGGGGGAGDAGEKKEPQAPIFHVETYQLFKATREGYSMIDLKGRLLTLTYVSFGQRF